MRLFFIIGSFAAGLAVATGAFGAHGLKKIVAPEMLDTWEKAVRYQMYHALGILLIALVFLHWPDQAKTLAWAAWLFLTGIFLFSGSLYLLVLSGVKWLGAITPLGGVAFVGGWMLLVLAAWRSG